MDSIGKLIYLSVAFVTLGAFADSKKSETAGASVHLVGKIKTDPKSPCAKDRGQLYIADGETRTLIHQVDVIPNGTFEFNLREGKYEIRVVTLAKCESVAYLLLKGSTPERKVELALEEKKGGKL